MERIREVPEIGNMDLRSKIINGLDLVDEETIKFLSSIPSGSKIIEIEGGMGEISEYLSELGNNVRLVGEHRLFFVYRESVFSKSKVIPMNINPDSIKAVNKVYYDYAIVHSPEYLRLALSIAKYVYNVVSKEVLSEKEPINHPEDPIVISENKDVGTKPESSIDSNNIVSTEQISKPDQITDPVTSDNEPSGNLE